MIDTVLVTHEGQAGRLSLNRPRALHALDTAMCAAMAAALTAWQDDAAVAAVIIDHAEGRGFCAGGDIRRVAASSAVDQVEAERFFAAEYALNLQLFHYSKPVIAFMDGITFGGGAGLAWPARWRVATENTRFAMPETAIGLFPDIGAGWYLPRLEGRVGLFLALTGARMDGAECAELGLATHYLPAERLDEAKARIAAHPDRIGGILGELSVSHPHARILDNIEKIDRLFASNRLESILSALDHDGSDWAVREAATLRARCPTSCKVAIRQLAEGLAMPDFLSEMTREYSLARTMTARADFREGVRAALIDKDHAPRWSPDRPEAVTDAMVDALFEPSPAAERWREDRMADGANRALTG